MRIVSFGSLELGVVLGAMLKIYYSLTGSSYESENASGWVLRLLLGFPAHGVWPVRSDQSRFTMCTFSMQHINNDSFEHFLLLGLQEDEVVVPATAVSSRHSC